MKRLFTVLLACIVLAACSSHTEETTTTIATTSAPASATTNALAGTPLSAYGTDLNKAKNVQNIVEDQAKKQAAQIEAATGGTSGGG